MNWILRFPRTCSLVRGYSAYYIALQYVPCVCIWHPFHGYTLDTSVSFMAEEVSSSAPVADSELEDARLLVVSAQEEYAQAFREGADAGIISAREDEVRGL